MATTKSWLCASALCALVGLAGCTSNGNSNGGNGPQPVMNPGQGQGQGAQPYVGSPSQSGMTAPLVMFLRGPEPAPAGGNITLDLEIQVNEGINAPVTLTVRVPQGATLLAGQPTEILTLPQPGKLFRQYVVQSPGPLSMPVVVEAIARDPNGAWGLRAERKYPAAAVMVPTQPRQPPMGRPPAPPPR